MAAMNLTYGRAPLCALLLVVACGDNGNTSSTTADTTEATSTTTSTSATTTDPTTAEPTTTGGSSSSAGGSSSGGPPPPACSTILAEDECKLADCDWASVVGYTHGTQGCQGNIKSLCTPKDTAGGIFVYWHDNNGDIEVVQFNTEPTDLGPDWQVCDCDGPLACFCSPAMLDCPDRLGEFCGAITNQNGCVNALASGSLVCEWFSLSPEGPNDTMCTGDPVTQVCLNAAMIGTDTCDPISLPYPQCGSWTDPVYWRDNNGVIEVTTRCGPAPVGWTLCVADDPTQPEECKCRCL